MSFLITLKRGRKTKTVCINPGKHRGHLYRAVVHGSIWTTRTRKHMKRALKRDEVSAKIQRIPYRDRYKKNPGPEAVELRLFIDNDGTLYRQMTTSIQKNLTKKFVKGTYNHTKAVKLWKYLADAGAKKYSKDHSTGNDWNTMFTVADRSAVARELADAWLAELKSGNRHNPRDAQRITKKQWYARGGLATTGLFRIQRRGVWHYYTR